MKAFLALLVLLALPLRLSAQVIGQNQNITVVDSGTACVTAPTACATFPLDASTGGITLSVSGTWTGTLTFEGTNNDGIWTSILVTNMATAVAATTTTANGLFTTGNTGLIKVRARATAAITGSALVTAAKGLGSAKGGSNGASGFVGTLAIVNGGTGSTTGLLVGTAAGIATTSTDGFVLQNSTAATAGVPVQQSPRLRLRSNVWNTTVTAANNTDDWWMESVPVSGATPSGLWKLCKSLNGGATTCPFTLSSSGDAIFGNTVTSQGLVASSISVGMRVTGGYRLVATADGLVNLNNSGGTIGSALKVDALPTVASGFGTSPSVTAGSTAFAGSVNVGTGGTATSGILNWNGTNFPSTPFCVADSGSSNVVTRVTPATGQITFNTTVAWTASDVISWLCVSSR